MPVRDLDAVMKPTGRSVHVMANRGANGIDGFLSSALGSCASTGTHTVALAGDLSVIHDIGALATARRLHIPLAIVAVNNDGGGIFHLLPQEGHPLFERHWGTPHGLNLSEVAGGFGVAAERVRDSGHLADLIATRPNGPLLLELVTDRGDNARLHREIRSAVAAVLSGLS
jgi:2-succinyl-5-enolpyruvyl-6-hydroxy-3-cyclohexene-1-carboxylate synthase